MERLITKKSSRCKTYIEVEYDSRKSCFFLTKIQIKIETIEFSSRRLKSESNQRIQTPNAIGNNLIKDRFFQTIVSMFFLQRII
jgi:hypothetical protein